jgi:hypothetical protein
LKSSESKRKTTNSEKAKSPRKIQLILALKSFRITGITGITWNHRVSFPLLQLFFISELSELLGRMDGNRQKGKISKGNNVENRNYTNIESQKQ